jgi:hypothetical protein
MAATVPLPAAASTEHLTEAFRRAGVLGDGRVCDVTVESARPTLVSHISRLRLRYEGAAPAAPVTVILKTGQPDSGGGRWNAGAREVAFYRQVAPAMTTHRAPRCYDACSNEDTRTWHLLLEDLTDTHFVASTWPLPPTTPQCEDIVDALADFHAEWWDDRRLGVSVGAWRDRVAIDTYVQALVAQYTSFADTLGDRLPAERRALYERFLDAAPRLFARLLSRRNLTVIHGDAHVWNAFLPRDERGTVRLFDWDAWSLHAGPHDLTYMMAVHWYPERRRRLEQMLLDRYHAALLVRGVEGYDRRALADDYRWSTLLHLARPLFLATHGIPPVVWWSHLERIMLAIDDLGCRELLG